jgi:hypothetical protein
MKKFLLMIVITVMTLTAAFAQQGRNQNGYSSHHYKRSYHRSRRVHRDNGNNGNNGNGDHRDHKDNGDHRN